MAPKGSGSIDERPTGADQRREQNFLADSVLPLLISRGSFPLPPHFQSVNTVMRTHCDADPFKKCPHTFRNPPHEKQRLTGGRGAHKMSLCLAAIMSHHFLWFCLASSNSTRDTLIHRFNLQKIYSSFCKMGH